MISQGPRCWFFVGVSMAYIFLEIQKYRDNSMESDIGQENSSGREGLDKLFSEEPITFRN